MATNTSETRRLIDSNELSEWLGIPVQTLNQWAYRSVGPPYIKVGRHRRYDPGAVQHWLDEQTRTGKAGVLP